MSLAAEKFIDAPFVETTYRDFAALAAVAWPLEPLATFKTAMQNVQLIIACEANLTLIVDTRFPTPVMVAAKINTVLDVITHGFEKHINANRIVKHLWSLPTNEIVPITMPNTILFATGSFNRKLVSWFNIQAITAITKKTPKTVTLTLTFALTKNSHIVTYVTVGRNSLSFDDRITEALALQHNVLTNYNTYLELNGSLGLPPLKYSPVLTAYITERNLVQLQPLVEQDIINGKQLELLTTYYYQQVNDFFTENDLARIHVDILLYLTDLLHHHPKTWRHNVSLHTHQLHEKMAKYIELLNKIKF